MEGIQITLNGQLPTINQIRGVARFCSALPFRGDCLSQVCRDRLISVLKANGTVYNTRYVQRCVPACGLHFQRPTLCDGPAVNERQGKAPEGDRTHVEHLRGYFY